MYFRRWSNTRYILMLVSTFLKWNCEPPNIIPWLSGQAFAKLLWQAHMTMAHCSAWCLSQSAGPGIGWSPAGRIQQAEAAPITSAVWKQGVRQEVQLGKGPPLVAHFLLKVSQPSQMTSTAKDQFSDAWTYEDIACLNPSTILQINLSFGHKEASVWCI